MDLRCMIALAQRSCLRFSVPEVSTAEFSGSGMMMKVILEKTRYNGWPELISGMVIVMLLFHVLQTILSCRLQGCDAELLSHLPPI